MTVTIAPLTEREFFAWYPLFAEYATSSGADASDEQVMRVWTSLQSEGGFALVARHDDTVAGFAHVRPFERLLQGDGGYQLEDLYVTPASRGRGIATALIEHVRGRAESERRPLLRWASQPEDGAAKALQDKFADASGGWVLQTVPVG